SSDGDWIAGYIVQPQPMAARKAASDVGPDLQQACNEGECDPMPLEYVPEFDSGFWFEFGVHPDDLPETIGAFSVASFTGPDGIAGLVEVPGAHLLYARA